MIDELIILKYNFSIFGYKLVPAGTDVLEFMGILDSEGFSLMVPGCDKDKFRYFRMLDLVRMLNLLEDHLWILFFV